MERLRPEPIISESGRRATEASALFPLTPRDLENLSTVPGFVSAERLFNPYRAGSEVYLTAFSILCQDNDGVPQTKFIAQKSIVSFGNSEASAQSRVRRTKFLQSQGIKTVEFFNLDGADIFEEYIPDAKDSQEGIAVIKSDRYPQEHRIELLSQLVRIAQALDQNGFKPVGPFFSDLVFDGKTFYFVDTGWDLGEPNPHSPNNESKNKLISRFKGTNLERVIEEMYISLPRAA
jgi:hypothetical protein